MTVPGPTVWITRTAPGADRLARTIRAAGFETVVSPLLTLDPDFPVPNVALLLDDVAALAFTSVNGLRFADLTPRRDWPVFTVGARTAEAARRAGFADVRPAGGDARSLAETIARDWGDQTGVLLVPGAERPAADLGALLNALLGDRASVRRVVVYRTVERTEPLPAGFDIVVLQSVRAAETLADRLAPRQAQGRIAVALSPAVAGPVRSSGFAEIRVAARPDENSLIEALGKAPGPV